MAYDTEYDRLKENIREWRTSDTGTLPSMKRILDAAEKELNRMPRPTHGTILVWAEEVGDKVLMLRSEVLTDDLLVNETRVAILRKPRLRSDIQTIPVLVSVKPKA